MRFYTKQHPFYCGIDLHARTMYVCILSQDGEVMLHRNMQASPDALLKAIAPYRDDMVIAVACIFTWYWLADLCAQEGLPCVLGHALSMQAIPGGKTTNDTIDSQQIAVLLRGGLLPQAAVSPAAMRATRDLRRRRTPLRRQRAELLAHIQPTTSQSTRPEMGKKIASKATRHGVAERLPAPAVPKSIAGALARIGHDDQRLRDVELSILTTAQQHQAQTLYRLRTVPGIGASLRVGRLYAIPAITRFSRVQDVLASCRLVKCTQESAGKRSGTAGTKSGNAHLPWAFSAAAVLFLRANPAGQQSLTTLEKQHGSGQALPLLGQQRGRTVSSMFQRHTAFALGKCLNGSGSGADEPHASLDHPGLSLRVVLCQACGAASLNAEEPRGPLARSLWPVIGHPLRLLSMGDRRVSWTCAAPPPRLRLTGERHPFSHPFA
jgi:transposase